MLLLACLLAAIVVLCSYSIFTVRRASRRGFMYFVQAMVPFGFLLAAIALQSTGLIGWAIGWGIAQTAIELIYLARE